MRFKLILSFLLVQYLFTQPASAEPKTYALEIQEEQSNLSPEDLALYLQDAWTSYQVQKGQNISAYFMAHSAQQIQLKISDDTDWDAEKILATRPKPQQVQIMSQDRQGQWYDTGITGKDFAGTALEGQDCQTAPTQTAREWYLDLTLTAEGKEKLAKITTELEGQNIGIFAEDMLVFAPIITRPVTDGQLEISAGMKKPEVQRLAQKLNEGEQVLSFKRKNTEGEWQELKLSVKDIFKATAKSRTHSIESVDKAIEFHIKPEFHAAFAQLTKELQGQVMAIFVNDELISAPTINQPITRGSGLIQGSFSMAEATKLVNELNNNKVSLNFRRKNMTNQQWEQIPLDKNAFESAALIDTHSGSILGLEQTCLKTGVKLHLNQRAQTILARTLSMNPQTQFRIYLEGELLHTFRADEVDTNSLFLGGKYTDSEASHIKTALMSEKMYVPLKISE